MSTPNQPGVTGGFQQIVTTLTALKHPFNSQEEAVL